MTRMDNDSATLCSRVRARLVDYVFLGAEGDDMGNDGVLSEIPAHLAQCRECDEVFKEVQRGVAALDDLPSEGETWMNGSVWDGLAAQLKSDAAHSPPCASESLSPYDEDFISAYHDAEIPRTDPALEAFEAHLPGCDICNERLASLEEVAECVRRFGYRLEEAVNIDLTHRVMETLRQDKTQTLEAAVCPEGMAWETLSAHLDGELDTAEMERVRQHLSACEVCREAHGQAAALSDQYRDFVAQLEAEVPDLWPALRSQLASDPSLATPWRESNVRRFPRWVALPVAAAVLLLLFSPLPGVLSPQKLAPKSQELAALPPGLSGPMMRGESDVGFPASKREAPFQDAAPEAEISTHPSESPRQSDGFALPSSDEYLFHLNNHELPEGDAPMMLDRPGGL